jgi:hypothetical protein
VDRQRRLDQGYHGADSSRVLLLLLEHSGGKDSGASDIVPFLRVGGNDDHGVEFLPKLGGLGSLAVIVVAIGGGGVAHQEAAWLIGDAVEGEREAAAKKIWALITI